MITRENTKALTVRNLQLGHQNKVLIQSMTNTKTADVNASLDQIERLHQAGAEIVRLAVFDMDDAEAIAKIRKNTEVPLVADIHFDYQLALKCVENGIDKIRINPGNIGSEEKVRLVADACKDHNIPIRIGINSGSLERNLLDKYGGPCVEAMLESADRHIEMLQKVAFDDICISFKSSSVPLTTAVYRAASEKYPYPLHLGVTEAGTYNISAIKSSAALGGLLFDGIGDTIRISVSSDPVEELKIAKTLLKCYGLCENVPDLISCPTCGRIQWDMLPIAARIEDYLNTVHADITVAVMGCAVNGPQEASRADIGVAGGKKEALLFTHGKMLRKIPQEEVYEELVKEINRYLEQKA